LWIGNDIQDIPGKEKGELSGTVHNPMSAKKKLEKIAA